MPIDWCSTSKVLDFYGKYLGFKFVAFCRACVFGVTVMFID